MKQYEEILIKHSLEKSFRALKSARMLFEDGDYTTAQNRAYYAVFYVVLALGYRNGYVSGKHHQLMGWFNKKFIYQEKVFDSSMAKIYKTLIDKRETFDYDMSVIPDKEVVSRNIELAEKFVNTVHSHI